MFKRLDYTYINVNEIHKKIYMRKPAHNRSNAF